MKKLLYTTLVLFFGATAHAQNWTAALPHVVAIVGTPSNNGSWFRLNTATGKEWQWNPNTAAWVVVPDGIDVITGAIAPAYIPTYLQSKFAINDSNELYRYWNSSWHHINDGGGISTVTTDPTLDGDGSIGDPLKIAQQSAASGEVLKWNGATWLPAADGGTTYTGGTGIDVTGTVITNTAPDQTVTIAGGGINSVTGTYPNFTVTGTEVDGSTTNEIQDLSLSGQALGVTGGAGVTLPIVNVTAGYGTTVGIASGNATVTVDTSLIGTVYDAQSVYRNWPLGNVNSYQGSTTKRNWLIYYNNIQSSSTRNAFAKFDTISLQGVGSTTNVFGNGIWMATSSSVADMLSGFSNNINHGGGFNLFGSGDINFTDWRASGTRGSILKALNWTSGSGDVAVSFFRSASSDVTSGLGKMPAGQEIGAIRFAAADTSRALGSSFNANFQYPQPCAAIVGYTFKSQFNNAHYGGVGIWTTNGSTTQFRAVAVDSTFSTTVRGGINTTPARINSFQVNGLTSAAGNNSLAVHNLTGTSNSLIVTNDGKTGLGVAAPAEKLEVAGNIKLTTAGNKIFIADGANASVGTATLVGGTITINTTAVTANSLIHVNHLTPIVTQGILSAPPASIVAGTSFVINSSSVADASVITWWIIN